MIRTVTITPEQSDYLAALSADARKATAMFDAAFTVICRGVGIKQAALTGLDGTTLTLDVSEEPTP